MVRELGNIEQIVDYPAHDRSGLVVVEVFERKRLKVRENVVAHIRLHTDADYVAVIRHKVVQGEFHDIDTGEDRPENQEETDVAVRDEIADHRSGDKRVEKIRHRENERADHIRNE